MKSTSYIAHLYKSFLEIHGITLALVGLALSVGGWFMVPATHETPTRIIVGVAILAIIALVVFIHSSFSTFVENKRILPSIIHAQPPPSIYDDAIALLLLEESPLFSYDCFVSAYHVENEIENLIGFGKVINIQENDKIQVLIILDTGYDKIWRQAKNSNKATIQKILVKPTVPSEFNTIIEESKKESS